MASQAAFAASAATAAILHESRMQQVCGKHMQTFYGLCRGGVEQMGLLFSEMAGAPMPPAVVLQLLSISEAQLNEAQTQKLVPTATRQQFEDAMCSAVDNADDIPRYSELLQKHIRRLQHAASVLEAVTPQLAQFHAQTGGSITAIERLLVQLTPLGRPMPPGMINALLRVPRDAKECTVDDVVACFSRDLDQSDTAAKISAVLEKHMQK
jgi:hypothetical protein